MPFEVPAGQSMLLVRKQAFEAAGLARSAIDERLGLAADEFRVEGDLIAIGPIPGDIDIREMLDELEGAGLVYFDDYFELSGNWPEWLKLWATGRAASVARGASSERS